MTEPTDTPPLEIFIYPGINRKWFTGPIHAEDAEARLYVPVADVSAAIARAVAAERERDALREALARTVVDLRGPLHVGSRAVSDARRMAADIIEAATMPRPAPQPAADGQDGVERAPPPEADGHSAGDGEGVAEPMERLLPDLSGGRGLWRRKEAHGGYSYWTDDIGGGRRVWDEGLDDLPTLMEVAERAAALARHEDEGAGDADDPHR